MGDNKEIVVLEDWQHILLRPTMYIGSIEPSEERVPVFRSGRIHMENMEISIGLYKLFHEILDNAIDEAKRMKGKMKSVRVDVDSATGMVTVADTGNGFYKGTQKNQKTGKTNIETAMSNLRAGSNFSNDDTSTALIGTNGVGASIVNVLSENFKVRSVNSEASFFMEWDKFESKGPEIKKRHEGDGCDLGTTVSFIPRKKEFRKSKWDRDIIYTQMIFKRFLLAKDPVLSKLDFRVFFDGTELDLKVPFYPAAAFVSDTPIGTLVVYESFEHSGSLSFMNSAMCTGIHQRIINEQINKELDDQLGHHFYETFISLNLPPKLVRFRDQNKTRLDSTRSEIEGTVMEHFRHRLREFYTTDLFKRILQKVEDRKMQTEVKKLRNVKKKVDIRNSPKYFPPSGRIENLFIVEGECLHEDTEICIIRGNEIGSSKIKNAQVGDMVITHLNRIKQINAKSTKIGKGYKIITKFGDLICSDVHKWLVYDQVEDVFKFLPTSDISADRHKLIKNKLAFLNRFFEIVDVHDREPNGKYTHTIVIDDDDYDLHIKSTPDKKFCVYVVAMLCFKMVRCSDIVPGDLLGVFD
jgi:hypothetical protein